MRLSTSHNVYRYYQTLIFPEFASSFFKIHNYPLRNYSVNIDKNIDLKVIYEIHFHGERSCFRYAGNSVDNVDRYYDILIRLDDFIAYFSHRYKESYLLNF